MKKTMIAAAILLAAPGTVFAANAVLNVEGVIQINGNTVIDANGQYTGAISGVTSIDGSKFERADGVYTYENSWGDGADSSYIYKLIIDGNSYTETDADGNVNYTSVYNGDGTYTAEYEYRDTDENCDADGCEYSWYTAKVNRTSSEKLINQPAFYLGMTTTEVYESQTLSGTIEKKYDDGRVVVEDIPQGKKSTFFEATTVSGILPSFEVNEVSYNNCIITVFDGSNEVICEGRESVYTQYGYGYETRQLIDYSPLSSAKNIGSSNNSSLERLYKQYLAKANKNK